jgi:nitrogen-specific signal transduction histidine kinase
MLDSGIRQKPVNRIATEATTNRMYSPTTRSTRTGGQGLGAMLRVFVAEHHGFDEVAADRQTFSSVMRNFLIDS